MANIEKETITLKNETSIELRSPQIADAQKFIEYSQHIFAHSEYVVTQPDEYEADLEKQKNWINDLNQKQASLSIIAVFENRIVGNIDFRHKAERRRMQHRGDFGIGIVKDFRGKGLGKILISKLIEWAKRQDNPIEKIELIVMAENKPALKLYKSLGFKEEGRIINEIKISEGKYIDGIFMGLWL